MRERAPGVYDPLSGIRNWVGAPYRTMDIGDVNELVALTHQPYMYRKQEERISKRYVDIAGGPQDEFIKESNQESVAVLRFALQSLWALSLGEKRMDEIIAFAEDVGNVCPRKLYRGETSLTFFDGSEAPTCRGGTTERWLDYRFKVSGSYKTVLWADLERRDASNLYFPYSCSTDSCFVDANGDVIPDAFDYEGPCYFLVRVGGIETSFNEGASPEMMKCNALAALIDYLGTLHLTEVELRVSGGRLGHVTNTHIAQAWRIAFEALTEITARNDKHGNRKPKYRVFCCTDCKSPRIIKYGKNAARCPLCSNNNTKKHKSSERRVY